MENSIWGRQVYGETTVVSCVRPPSCLDVDCLLPAWFCFVGEPGEPPHLVHQVRPGQDAPAAAGVHSGGQRGETGGDGASRKRPASPWQQRRTSEERWVLPPPCPPSYTLSHNHTRVKSHQEYIRSNLGRIVYHAVKVQIFQLLPLTFETTNQ